MLTDTGILRNCAVKYNVCVCGRKSVIDAIAIGGDPAGTTAVALLASRRRRVALVESVRLPQTPEAGNE
jgi:hypothetical protein